MTATREHSRLYGGAVRQHPEGLHVRRHNQRQWGLWNGTERMGTYASETAANEALHRENLIRNNVGPEWGFVLT